MPNEMYWTAHPDKKIIAAVVYLIVRLPDA